MGFLPYAGVKLAAALLSPFGSKADRSLTRRLGRLAEAISYPPSVQYFMFRRLFGPEDLLRLFSPQFAAGIDPDGPAKWFCDLYESFDCPDEVAVAQRHDLATYLPDDLLVKTDIASMACSLELRVPLLDHNLVSLGLSLPTELKVRHRKGKHILRQAFADWLPREVFTQPKRGFGVPLGRWLRNELRPVLEETLLDPSLDKAGIFDRRSLMGLLADHFSGRDDHGHRLWALLVFARWLARQGG